VNLQFNTPDTNVIIDYFLEEKQETQKYFSLIENGQMPNSFILKSILDELFNVLYYKYTLIRKVVIESKITRKPIKVLARLEKYAPIRKFIMQFPEEELMNFLFGFNRSNFSKIISRLRAIFNYNIVDRSLSSDYFDKLDSELINLHIGDKEDRKHLIMLYDYQKTVTTTIYFLTYDNLHLLSNKNKIKEWNKFIEVTTPEVFINILS